MKNLYIFILLIILTSFSFLFISFAPKINRRNHIDRRIIERGHYDRRTKKNIRYIDKRILIITVIIISSILLLLFINSF